MPDLVQLNEATATKRYLFFYCVDATDGITPETGEAGGQPQISTNGGAFTDTGIGVLVAMGNGQYYAAVTQAAVNGAVGDRILGRYKSANTAEAPSLNSLIVTTHDPNANEAQVVGMDAGVVTAAAVATGAIDADALATDAVNEIVDQVWDEATADHVTAGTFGLKLGNVSALSGTNGHTVTVQTGGAAAIPGVRVEIYDSGNTTFVTSGVTNGSGQVALANMTAGTYKARCSLNGYSFTIPTTVTITADGETTTITGTAVSVLADSTTYESRPLRRQKIRYNDANDENLLTYQLVVGGAKVVPSSATVTIYAPGGTTALVSAAAMTVSGTLMTYAIDTTTTASWPVDEGYRADIVVTVSGTTYPAHLVFDVATYTLRLSVTKDQLVALDGGVRNFLNDSDADLSEVIEACRDEIQFILETKAVEGGQLLENMLLDESRLAIPARRYILAHIFESKGNPERAEYHRKIWESMLPNIFTLPMDTGQGGSESTTTGGAQMIRMMP